MWYLLIIKILLMIFAKHLYVPFMGSLFIHQTVHGLKTRTLSKYKIKKVAL